jgi:uncharacterized protein YuzE
MSRGPVSGHVFRVERKRGLTPPPTSVRWTLHALHKAERLGYTREQVERAVLERHAECRRNPGSGGWRVTDGKLMIVNDYPDRADLARAWIITLWRRR